MVYNINTEASIKKPWRQTLERYSLKELCKGIMQSKEVAEMARTSRWRSWTKLETWLECSGIKDQIRVAG